MNNPNRHISPALYILIILILVFSLCCACAAGVAATSLYFNLHKISGAALLETSPAIEATDPIPAPTITAETVAGSNPEPTLVQIDPTKPIEPTQESPGSPIQPIPLPESNAGNETLATLEQTIVPINDLIALAERLENKENLPVSLEFPLKIYQVGDQETFWVINADTNENFQVSATLRDVTDHVYFWIEDGVSYNERQLKALADTFEEKIYPTNREFFGSEWTPGVDADPHLFILYADGLGGKVAGYYSSADEYLPLVREYSNGHEMFLFSASQDLNSEFAYGILAHEFQHMIHWYRDRNEEIWLNEGASDLAMFLNGYTIGGHDHLFANDPDIQLNDWPNNSTSNAEHYGASFLFMAYFLDRFGEEATKSLVSEPANGMVSIDKVLSELNILDTIRGEPTTAEGFFTDWLIANLLQDDRVADGRYTYHNYPAAPDFSPTETISKCPSKASEKTVHQFGVNYVEIRCKGDFNIHFEGDTQVAVIPENPYSGSYAFYSNRGDESDMTLTREFDFSNQSAPITLSYWAWYDLEQDYDYLYLTASLDGQDWQIITTPSGTAEDPTGNSYGWGYNGWSGGGPQWIQEDVDLSQFAGKKVQLRFEYVTDGAVNGEGFLLDDIAVPEFGYFSDFEADDGGWQTEGFVRIQNVLPQTYRLALITKGRETTVEMISIPADNIVDIPFQIGGATQEVILVVTGVTRFTHQNAQYRLSIQPK